MPKRRQRARKEPVRSLLTGGREVPGDPEDATLLKGSAKSSSTSAHGTSPSHTSTLETARSGGIFGVLQLLGPGLITGASDDDPSGIGTYSQVGSQYGFQLLWTALFSFPLMVAMQEMCARIALHTGVGLGVTLRKKFPTWLIITVALALLAANTVNIGADLGAVAAGGQLLSGNHVGAIWLVIPVGVLICVMQLFVSYTLIYRTFKFLTLAMFAYVITVFVSHPSLIQLLINTAIPHISLDKNFITAVVAIFGTTISPYLFFWQASSEVDEMKAAGQRSPRSRRGTTKRALKAARTDVVIGMAFSQIVMYCIIATNAATLHAHGLTNIQSATQAANALKPLAGPFASYLFAIGLIGTGLLAIPVLAGSAVYTIKEVMGFRGSLAVKPSYRPTFYILLTAAVLIGAGLNFAGVNPISALFITAVINGILAPPLMILITLLGSDRKVMKQNVNSRVSSIVNWVGVTTMTLAALGVVYTSL